LKEGDGNMLGRGGDHCCQIAVKSAANSLDDMKKLSMGKVPSLLFFLKKQSDLQRIIRKSCAQKILYSRPRLRHFTQVALPFYKVEKGGGKVHTEVCILTTAFLYTNY
jgi:hypothetical protein